MVDVSRVQKFCAHILCTLVSSVHEFWCTNVDLNSWKIVPKKGFKYHLSPEAVPGSLENSR